MPSKTKNAIAGFIVIIIAVTIAAVFDIAGALKKRVKDDVDVAYTSTGRCQWDIGGTPMNFENIFSFKIVENNTGNRIKYVFTMHNGKVYRFYTGTQFSVQDIVNEVRVCTQGRAFGHNLLY